MCVYVRVYGNVLVVCDVFACVSSSSAVSSALHCVSNARKFSSSCKIVFF